MDKEKKIYIEGIYNYCDRWCEKCKFTSNCFLFSQESKIRTYEILHNGNMPSADEIFKMNDVPEDEDELNLPEDNEEDFFSGEEFESFESEGVDFEREKRERFRNIDNPLDSLSNKYFKSAHRLLKEINEKNKLETFAKEKLKDIIFKKIFDNFETVSWFHAFIHVKLKRALTSKNNMMKEDDEEMKEISKHDMDGTAKIAIIGINKSTHALNNLYKLLPEFSDEISELLILLGKILNLAEDEFPDYNKFIRPGFDTIQ